jgi:hypothetical protein
MARRRRTRVGTVRRGLPPARIGAKEMKIRFSDAVVADDQDRILTIPWTPPSPYQRREIIQGEGGPSSPIRPMRIRARGLPRSPLQRPSLVGQADDPSDHRVAGCPRGRDRTLNPHDAVASLCRAANCCSGDRGTSVARVWRQSPDGLADGLIPAMDRTRS